MIESTGVDAGQDGEGVVGEVMGAHSDAGQALLDSIFDESGGDVGTEDVMPPAPAPAPAPVVPPVVKPATVDPVIKVPDALLGIKDEAAPIAPAAPAPAPADDFKGADEAYDKETEKTAARFSNTEQRRAFYAVRNEAKAERIKAREAQKALSENQRKLAEYEQQIKKAAEATSVNKPKEIPAEILEKLNTMEKQNKEYEDKLGRLDLAQSETFKKQYELPLQGIQAKVTRLLSSKDRTPEQVKDMAGRLMSTHTRDEQIDLLNEEPMAVQGAILNILDDARELSENRQIALENWKASKAAVEAENSRRASVAFLQNIYGNTEEAVKVLNAEGNFLLTALPDNPEWNQAVEERVNAARGILQTADDKTLIKYVVDGVTAAPLRDMYRSVVAAYRKLKVEADALANGGAKLAPAGAPPPAAPVKKEYKSGAEVIEDVFGPDENVG